VKGPYLLPVLLMLLPAFAVALLLPGNSPRSAIAAADPFRCTGWSLFFPATGIVGWTYQDPAGTDRDADGHRTVHTGLDIFGEGGDGSPVFAPADGFVSRQPGSDNVNIVLPGVTNIVTGEAGLEIYLTHLHHGLVRNQVFHAGEVIALQEGDHVHFSVGAFIGYDDREIEQTQDPSPYFHAALSFSSAAGERQSVDHWCYSVESVQAPAPPPAPQQDPLPPQAPLVHVVVSGNTLSGIAETYGVTVEDLITANGLDEDDLLQIDQELVIPGATGAAAPAATASPSGPSSATGPQTYVVESGDTLWSIAEKFGTDVESIVELNSLADPDVLALGDELLIP
jgi:LysM repeat protein